MSEDVANTAERHGLSAGAGQALYDALIAGGGTQAQFSHPDLGGMGQWSGGMTQIGDMFNDGLKAKVSAFCRDVSAWAVDAHGGSSPVAAGGGPVPSRLPIDRTATTTQISPASTGFRQRSHVLTRCHWESHTTQSD